jgi:hypothetical protein
MNFLLSFDDMKGLRQSAAVRLAERQFPQRVPQDRDFVRGQEQEQQGDDAEHEAKGQDGRPAADGNRQTARLQNNGTALIAGGGRRWIISCRESRGSCHTRRQHGCDDAAVAHHRSAVVSLPDGSDGRHPPGPGPITYTYYTLSGCHRLSPG